MQRNLLRTAVVTSALLAGGGGVAAWQQHSQVRVATAESAAPLSKQASRGPAEKKLEGRCSCGKVHWVAHGKPEFTFNCHCSLCRRSGGAAFVSAAAFKPDSITWSGEMVDYKPANSKVPRRFCASCRSYVAEDARPVLGVFALPLGLTDPQPDKIYWPSQHIFYDSRVVDVSDKLPKFMQMPGGAQF